MKKLDVAKKMKPNIYKYGKQKGKASLNPSHKSKDNIVMEGKDEQEKS